LAAKWYTLCSKPHKENVLWRQLQLEGYEVFFPRYLAQTSSLNTLKVKPFFPGYMFVKTDLSIVNISTFQWMPFSVGLVSFDNQPLNVPEDLIQAIRKRLEKINAMTTQLLDSVERYDWVKSNASPFIGYESVFDQASSGDTRVAELFRLLTDFTYQIGKVSLEQNNPDFVARKGNQ